MPPEPSFKPSKEPSERESARGRVWAHYQEVIPNGRRYRLDAARRRVIDAALELASVQECCEAITGLSRSDYHREHGYLDVSYALRGGGRNPRPDATILRMRAIAQGEVGAGNGRGRLQRATYSAGRTWDELTPGEQAVARDNAAMGVWPDEEREASAPAPSGPREAWTAETFGGDEE